MMIIVNYLMNFRNCFYELQFIMESNHPLLFYLHRLHWLINIQLILDNLKIQQSVKCSNRLF